MAEQREKKEVWCLDDGRENKPVFVGTREELARHFAMTICGGVLEGGDQRAHPPYGWKDDADPAVMTDQDIRWELIWRGFWSEHFRGTITRV